MKIENLGQLIAHLAKKAGIKEDDQNLINVLSNAELTKVSLRDEFVNAIDNNLLAMDAALDQHPKIRAKYAAEILNPFDSRLTAIIDELDIDDAGKDELRKVKSTYQRFETVNARLKEVLEAKSKASGSATSADNKALQDKIDNLQKDLRDAKAATVKAEKDYEQKLLTDKKEFRLQSKFPGLKTTLENLPPDVQNKIIREIIDKELQEQNADLQFDDLGELQPFTKDGSKLYSQNNTVINLDSLIETALSKNQLLPKAPPPTPPAGGQPGGQQQHFTPAPAFVPGGNGGGQPPAGTNQTVRDINLEAIKAFEAAPN